jgi:hypothetical protein
MEDETSGKYTGHGGRRNGYKLFVGAPEEDSLIERPSPLLLSTFRTTKHCLVLCNSGITNALSIVLIIVHFTR